MSIGQGVLLLAAFLLMKTKCDVDHDTMKTSSLKRYISSTDRILMTNSAYK